MYQHHLHSSGLIIRSMCFIVFFRLHFLPPWWWMSLRVQSLKILSSSTASEPGICRSRGPFLAEHTSPVSLGHLLCCLPVFFICPFSAKPAFLTCSVWLWGLGFFPLINSVRAHPASITFYFFGPSSTKFSVQPSSPLFSAQALLSLLCTKLLSSPIVSCLTFCLSAPAKNA